MDWHIICEKLRKAAENALVLMLFLLLVKPQLPFKLFKFHFIYQQEK